MNAHSHPRPQLGQRQAPAAGRLAYFCRKFPRGISPRSYQQLVMRRPELRSLGWVLKRRPAQKVVRAAALQADMQAAPLDWPASFTNA